METIRASWTPAAAAVADPPTTSESGELIENDLGSVRSNTLPPPVRTPGRLAALVPPSKVPLEPKSAIEPSSCAWRPHFVASFGSDLSSHWTMSIGRPSAHSLLTARSAAFKPFCASVVTLGNARAPLRVPIDVNLSGAPVHAEFVAVAAAPPPPFELLLLLQPAITDA